jgi:Domain of unknown function (DUF4189)
MKGMTAAVVGISATVLVGGAVAVAPPAKADCTQGSCYGAIAYSTSNGNARSDINNPSQSVADNNAIAGCNKAGNVNDCEVVVRGMQCLALATVPTGENELYYGGVGSTKSAADAAALAGHSGFTIEVEECNAGSS